MKRFIILILCCLVAGLFNAAFCHEVRPAYLEINQIDSIHYAIIWKTPVTAGRTIQIRPILPEGFTMDLVKQKVTTGSMNQLYQGTYTASIIGQNIYIENLERTLIDVFTKIQLADDLTFTFLIQADKPYCHIPQTPNQYQVINSYIRLGIEHILEGYDHLLFVLALLLLISSLSNLFWTVTCFTLAHSVTLALASLNIFSLPSAPVEAVIALSILFLAKEYIDVQRDKPSMTAKYPWAVSFGFGLLHGFGFAGALQDIGFPQQQLFTALLSFNIGVEIGQILFILICLTLYLIWTKAFKSKGHQQLKTILAYTIGSVASFWLVQRIVNIL